MKKTSIKKHTTGSRISKLLSAVLVLILALSALPICIPANAALVIQPKDLRGVTYKVEITHDSKASGWNSASLKINYKYGDRYEQVDLTDEFAKGETITKTYELLSAIPSSLQLYLDFGGGFTVRSHSGRIKLYADDVEILNEPYSARSYPFNSSDATLDFGIYGITETEVIDPDGASTVYPTVKQAWSKAKEKNGSTVKLTDASSVTETLEVTNSITVDLNGQLLNNTEYTRLFHVKKGGRLNLIDSDPTRDTGETYLCTAGITGKVEDIDARSYHLTGGGIYHGGSKESGGAIKVDEGGKLNVEGCTFTDCHSSENGGAIYCDGEMTLNGTQFIFCTAMKGSGGAICIAHQPYVSFENLTFERCQAENGGAISTVNAQYNGRIGKFDNCTFNRCRAEEYGGAIYHTGRDDIKANDLVFKLCDAEYGGGVFLTSSRSGHERFGFGFAVSGGEFVNCTARDSGGGVAYDDAGEVKLKNVEFNGCSSEEDGGALYLKSQRDVDRGEKDFQNILMDGCDIHHCTAKENGGAVFVESSHNSTLVNKTLLYNSKVHDNTADKGGGLCVESFYVYLADSTITNNKATGKYGGGVYVDSLYDIELAGAIVIRNNTASNAVNNLCLQNGTFSSAKMYSGGLEDGAYIGISSTSDSAATVGLNISQYQANKYLHADVDGRTFSMTNTKEVTTPLFASVISDNISLIIIIGGVILIAGVIGLLYFRKKKKEGKKNEAEAEQTDAEADEENK